MDIPLNFEEVTLAIRMQIVARENNHWERAFSKWAREKKKADSI